MTHRHYKDRGTIYVLYLILNRSITIDYEIVSQNFSFYTERSDGRTLR